MAWVRLRHTAQIELVDLRSFHVSKILRLSASHWREIVCSSRSDGGPRYWRARWRTERETKGGLGTYDFWIMENKCGVTAAL